MITIIQTKKEVEMRWANNNNSLPTIAAVAPISSSTTVILTPRTSFKRITTPMSALHPHTQEAETLQYQDQLYCRRKGYSNDQQHHH